MVKTDWRSSLSSVHFEHLMRLKIEGPEIDKYCAKACVLVFFQKPRRQRKQASAFIPSKTVNVMILTVLIMTVILMVMSPMPRDVMYS